MSGVRLVLCGFKDEISKEGGGCEFFGGRFCFCGRIVFDF